MNHRSLLLLISLAISQAADPRAAQVQSKIDLIEAGKAKRGAVIAFPVDELNAWARVKAHEEIPQGLRQPRVELGNNTATGYALVDFLKMREGAGVDTNWFMAKLIQGEKPVKAVVRVQSANGRATVHIVRVEIGGLAVSGTTLDFLIHTFLLPLYPNAKIDQPFELNQFINHIDLTPTAAHAYLK